MEKNDIKEFFTNYIKPYIPYESSKLNDKIMDYISDNILPEMYIENNSYFREMFEQNRVPDDIYKFLLVAIGVPEEVARSLTKSEQIIFLRILSDFQRIKGTVSFFKNVGKSFNDDFDISELYAVYDEDISKWILKPHIIYSGMTTDKPLKDRIISYDQVYYSIPSLLISVDQLNYIKKTSSAVFPLKTNILMLEYDFSYKISSLFGIVTAAVLLEYGSIPIVITFKDVNFQLELKTIYLLWYYILMKSKNFNFDGIGPLSGIIYNTSTAYTMGEVEDIIEEYNNINDVHDVTEFYNRYITPLTTLYNSSGTTIEELKDNIRKINPQVLTYLDARIFSNPSVDPDKELSLLTNELMMSLVLFQYKITNDSFSNLFEIFLQSLPHLSILPEHRASYTILYNLKPYHVELLTKHYENIICDDKLNTVLPNIDSGYSIQMVRTSFVDKMEDEYEFTGGDFEENNIPMSWIQESATIGINDQQVFKVENGTPPYIWTIDNPNFEILNSNPKISTPQNTLISVSASINDQVTITVYDYNENEISSMVTCI